MFYFQGVLQHFPNTSNMFPTQGSPFLDSFLTKLSPGEGILTLSRVLKCCLTRCLIELECKTTFHPQVYHPVRHNSLHTLYAESHRLYKMILFTTLITITLNIVHQVFKGQFYIKINK